MYNHSSPRRSVAAYDGFGTVQDPNEYLNAPAMIMNGTDAPVYSPHQTTVIQSAIDACRNFEVLNSSDLNTLEAEHGAVQARISSIVDRLDVEHKMKDAASSLSALHINGKVDQTRESKRLSRFFGGANHSPEKANRRLSRQAEEEVQLSADRIAHLESSRAELVQRQMVIERTILQHHAAVLALVSQSQPLPDPRPSGHTRNTSQGLGHNRQRSSISIGRGAGRSGGGDHSRNSSFASTMGSTVLAQQEMAGSAPSSNGLNYGLGTLRETDQHLVADVDALAERVSAALPQVTPNPNKISFIRRAFEKVVQDSEDSARQVEAYKTQAQTAEERVRYLTSELRRIERSNGISAESREREAQAQAHIAQINQELASERQRSLDIRSRYETQRQELARVVQTLEDVTRLAVGYESQRSEYTSALDQLERKVESLESERGLLEARALAASDSGASILCKEFQRIVRELHERHYTEIRELRASRIAESGPDSKDSVARATTASSPVASTPPLASAPTAESATPAKPPMLATPAQTETSAANSSLHSTPASAYLPPNVTTQSTNAAGNSPSNSTNNSASHSNRLAPRDNPVVTKPTLEVDTRSEISVEKRSPTSSLYPSAPASSTDLNPSTLGHPLNLRAYNHDTSGNTGDTSSRYDQDNASEDDIL